MISVASGGTAERIAWRIWFSALRAGSGIAAKYSSTVLGAGFFSGEAFAFAARRLEAAGLATVLEGVLLVRWWRPCVAVRWVRFFMR